MISYLHIVFLRYAYLWFLEHGTPVMQEIPYESLDPNASKLVIFHGFGSADAEIRAMKY